MESQTIVLEFDRMSEDLMRGLDWTDYELQAALRLLSGNVAKLKEFLAVFVSFLTFCFCLGCFYNSPCIILPILST